MAGHVFMKNILFDWTCQHTRLNPLTASAAHIRVFTKLITTFSTAF